MQRIRKSNFSKVEDAVKRLEKHRTQRAKIWSIDGNYVDVKPILGVGMLTHVEVYGDPSTLKIGDIVLMMWVDKPGAPSKVPIVMTSGYGQQVGGPGKLTGTITGNMIALGAIQPEHLAFSIDREAHDMMYEAGWRTTTDGTLYASYTYLTPTGQLTLGRDPDVIKLDGEHATYRIWIGDQDPTSAVFSVEKDGSIFATAGSIAGWTLSANSFTADSGNAGINAGSSPYIQLGGASAFMTGTGIWMGKDTDTTYKLRVGDPAGDHMYWDGNELYITGTFVGDANIANTDADFFTINYDDDNVDAGLIIMHPVNDFTLTWDGNNLDFYGPGALNSYFTSNTDNSFIYIESGMDGGAEISGIVFTSASGNAFSIQKDTIHALNVYDYTANKDVLIFNPDSTIEAAPETNWEFNTGSGYILPSTGYTQNIGMLTQKFLTVHAAESWIDTIVAHNTMATIGGRIIVSPTTTVEVDLPAGQTAMIVKHNQLDYADYFYAEANNQFEYMQVVGIGISAVNQTTDTFTISGTTNWTSYFQASDTFRVSNSTGNNGIYTVQSSTYGTSTEVTVVEEIPDATADGAIVWVSDAGSSPYRYFYITRDKDGSGSNAWSAGTALVSTADGWMDLYSYAGMYSSTVGPTIAGYTRTSITNYSDYTHAWAVGHLEGIAGIGTGVYGLWAGEGTGDTDGQIFATTSELSIYNADLSIHDGTNTVFTLDRTTPYLSMGSTAPTDYGTAGNVGLWIGNDSGTYKFRLGDFDGERIQWDGSSLAIYSDVNNYVDLSSSSMTFYANSTPVLGLNTPSSGNATFGSTSGVHMLYDGNLKFKDGVDIGSWIDTDGTINLQSGSVASGASLMYWHHGSYGSPVMKVGSWGGGGGVSGTVEVDLGTASGVAANMRVHAKATGAGSSPYVTLEVNDQDIFYVDATDAMANANLRVSDDVIIGSVSSSPGYDLHIYTNDTSTEQQFVIEQAGTGDASMAFLTSGVRRWTMGIDNSAGDLFKISYSTGLGTNTVLSLDTHALALTSGVSLEVNDTIYINDASTYLAEASGDDRVVLGTSYGQVAIGCLNGTYAHYTSSTALHYFYGNTSCQGDFRAGGGLASGNISFNAGTGDVLYSNDLVSYKNSTSYNVYGTHWLTTLVSLYAGTTRTSANNGNVTLSGIPANATAVYVTGVASANAANKYFYIGHPSGSANFQEHYVPVSGQFIGINGWVPCNSTPQINFTYQTGVTFTLYLRIGGYTI